MCIGAGELVQAVVIGGSPAGLNLVLAGDGPCVPAGTGGGTGTVAQGNGGSSAWVVAPTAQAPALPGSDTDFTPVTVGTSSTTVIPAATTSRARAVINNNSTTATMWCRADGGTASVNMGVELAANGGSYEWDYPNAGIAAINCIMASGSATATGEYHQQ